MMARSRPFRDGLTEGAYYRLPTVIWRSRHLSIECLATAGPRIVRLIPAGSQINLLAELPDLHWPTPWGDYYPRGGHRLCHAPEAFPRTYVPDNAGVEVDVLQDALYLRGPVEAPTGIRKTLAVRLAEDRPSVQVIHRLANEGLWPVELAPWAITQLPLGGVAALPMAASADGSGGTAPDRHVAFWPYTRLDDPRLQLGSDEILVQGKAGAPLKLGCWSLTGCVDYRYRGFRFVKRVLPQPGAAYPDTGCNVEFYCNEDVLELETLGPLQRVEPGQAVEHVETWEVSHVS